MSKPLIISILSIIISIINIIYTHFKFKQSEKFHQEKLEYNKDKDKDDFIISFKDALHELSINMSELIINKEEIDLESKDKFLYVLENKYHKSIIVKFLNEDIYNQFMTLKIKIDEMLDKVVYQKNYYDIKYAMRDIRYFLNDLNIHIEQHNI